MRHRRRKKKEKGTSGIQAAREELGGQTDSRAEGQKNHRGGRERDRGDQRGWTESPTEAQLRQPG